MAKEQKQLNVNELLQIEQNLNETKEITVGSYTLKLYKNFSESNEMGIEFDSSNLVVLYLIKYFTDLDIPNDLKTQIRIFKILIDAGFLTEIISQFDEDEVMKIATYINKAAEYLRALADAARETKALQDVAQEKIKTPEANTDVVS
jgi:hypothetical protein